MIESRVSAASGGSARKISYQFRKRCPIKDTSNAQIDRCNDHLGRVNAILT
jgi:hypothetical protein